jgi:hypothetical protein
MLRVDMATIVPRYAPYIIAFVERMGALGFRDGDNFVLASIDFDRWR